MMIMGFSCGFFITNVQGKSSQTNTETGECRFEPIETSELALVSPSVSFSPRVTHCIKKMILLDARRRREERSK